MSAPKSLSQIRKAFIEFYLAKQHAVIPSAPLVPQNDPTTLFTSSGMQPLVPYLLGEVHPEGKRLVNSQKCFRAVDIEEVGDNRHTTYFEMLGNWSLGDYFKTEQLSWVFEFLTKVLELDPQRLYVTVFAGNTDLNIEQDNESVAIWQQLFAEVKIEAKAIRGADKDGMQGGRIFFYPEQKNWWSRSGVPAQMPIGEPGGPDSEVFYDFGENLNLHESSAFANQPCHVNCDCGRFMEIGNSVFMQYLKKDDGGFGLLPKPNVDFGGGLERLVAAAENKADVFTSSSFTKIIAAIAAQAEVPYVEESAKRNYRVIADHVRAAVMLAADGVFPGSKEQSYFCRRLVRRAARYARLLGITKPIIAEVGKAVIAEYEDVYPEVKNDNILTALHAEELKFQQALDKGLRELDKLSQLDGQAAFKLYESYGFPFELTQEIAAERGAVINEADFNAAKTNHANASRTAAAGKFKGGLADESEQTIKFHTATHLLHAALRNLLGDEVRQEGSNINAQRLRFDFRFPRALTTQEQQQVIDQVNTWIKADLPVTKQILDKEKALASGAIAFFKEKYPEKVSVYTIGKDVDNDWISKEFCGGPHVDHTGEIGELKLQKEQSAGQGLRRVYLVTAS